MTLPETFIGLYISGFGAILVLLGIVEMLLPRQAFHLWKKWAGSRYFFLHGLLLMCVGFPLTMFQGRFEGIIFFTGIFIVFSGPFILLFPERFSRTFEMAEEEMGEGGAKKIIYFEAFMRIAVGGICLASVF